MLTAVASSLEPKQIGDIVRKRPLFIWVKPFLRLNYKRRMMYAIDLASDFRGARARGDVSAMQKIADEYVEALRPSQDSAFRHIWTLLDAVESKFGELYATMGMLTPDSSFTLESMVDDIPYMDRKKVLLALMRAREANRGDN